jgi:hypothetical protein
MNAAEQHAAANAPAPTERGPITDTRLETLGLDVREVDVPGTEDALDAFFGDL